MPSSSASRTLRRRSLPVSPYGSSGRNSTRDAGALDAEGYLFLEGRIDDVIVRGGENLSPGEIEDTLLAVSYTHLTLPTN